ncbi:MAG: hypothetical protein ABI594_04985 [Ginsengibacter sp.]
MGVKQVILSLIHRHIHPLKPLQERRMHTSGEVGLLNLVRID